MGVNRLFWLFYIHYIRRFEWKGDWSDNSSKWTPDVIRQVQNFTRADDGTFWMSVNDFVRFYEGVNKRLSPESHNNCYRSVFANSMKIITTVR